MLHELLIKNFAIIDELNISFQAGLSVLTGETGAGKTIIVSALDLVLGGKASPEFIRTGEARASVEASFDISGLEDIKQMLAAQGIEFPDNTLILKRQLKQEGRSSCYANGSLIPLGILSKLGQELIDIHGQHQHQLLLKPDTHIDFLDAFGNLVDLREQLTQTYSVWQDKQNYLNQLNQDNKQKDERRELLKFQMQEIDALNLEEGEQEALLRENKILQNAGKLLEAGGFIYETIYNAEGSVTEKLAGAQVRLKEMGQVDANLSQYTETLESIQCQLEDIALSLRSYTEGIEYDPGRQQEIEERLVELEKLEKKYGGSVTKMQDYRKQIDTEYQSLTNLDEQIEAASREVTSLTNQLNNLASKLSDKRKQATKQIDSRISGELEHLGMGKCKFKTRITPISPDLPNSQNTYTGDAKGIDQVEFLFTANVGEEVKPLAKTASGGEISRVMLAFKGVLAGGDQVPTLIFDEVDAGIGGRIAQVVGKKLKTLAQSHQIICITHLPQIAAYAKHHYKVGKIASQSRTIASIKKLVKEEKVAEIARMLGGEKITPTTLKHAQEIIDNSQ